MRRAGPADRGQHRAWVRYSSSQCGSVIGMNDNPSTVLKGSGFRAVIEPDRWARGSYTLVVDGTPQSHVNLDDPTQLFFEYVQRIGHVIDQLPPEIGRASCRERV